MLRRTPYLKKIREANLLSLRKLAALSGVDRRTIGDLEAERREARPETIEKLAAALGVPTEDLVGRAGMSPEQMHAFLDSILTQKTTYGPGDPLYDDDLIVPRSDAEILEFMLENPGLRRRIEVLLDQRDKVRAAIQAADEELRSLEAQSRKGSA